jgi:hypothetical protein
MLASRLVATSGYVWLYEMAQNLAGNKNNILHTSFCKFEQLIFQNMLKYGG